MPDNGLTEQQKKWMASVRASLETSTGKTLDAWVEIAAGCPETRPRGRQKWLKDLHGLGQNYAMLVLGEVARRSGETPRDPDAMKVSLWSDPNSAAIAQALQARVDALPGSITGQRKTYTTWSRNFAFAAARPVKGGTVRLGLAVGPDVNTRLAVAEKEGWSERLKSVVELESPDQVDQDLGDLMAAAFDLS
jgi:hypothetical protein